jgi:polyhydroxyalkanoate synthesis regulator phasin/type IV secretory pathway VirB10-like protein
MAFKLPKFKAFSNVDAKSRMFLLFATVALVSFAGYFVIHYFSATVGTGAAQLAEAPNNLVSVPGGDTSPEYQRTLEEENARRQSEAEAKGVGAGASAIPTVINSNVTETSCYMCPSEDNPNIEADIESLYNKGRLAREDADRLKNLAKNNVSIEEYAQALDELVRSGKLTPEEARALLEKYKKQHANTAANESAKIMDILIKGGKLPLDTANDLLALQKQGLTPAEYAAELQRLVREGKISPETAKALLAQYTQQFSKEAAKRGAFQLDQMAKAGQITPDVAKHLKELQGKNLSLADYTAEINRLVTEGKMTPAAARKLIEQYRAQKIDASASADTLGAVTDARNAMLAGLKNLVAEGKVPPDIATLLTAMQDKNVSPEEYDAMLKRLVAEGKISPETAAMLSQQYRALRKAAATAGPIGELMANGGASSDLAKRLLALQANNATREAYVAALKKAVAEGTISPDQAAALLKQYEAAITPINGLIPSIDTTIPTAGFANLQRRVQESQAPSAPAEAEFTKPQVVDRTAENQERLKRIQAYQTAMANQAQSLINTAWQVPTMRHMGGSFEGMDAAGVNSTQVTLGSGSTNAADKATKQPQTALIKSGTIIFAVLDTAVDSDYPDTPVMATLIEGPFKGARLLGKLALAQGQDKLSLNFSMMDMEAWPTTKTISAFAIDPDTARTVMASEVDHHYMERWGTIMATSFLQGYSTAITNQGTSTTGVFGTSTSHPELSAGSKFAVGLGQIGMNLNQIALQNLNRPTTVKITAGVGIGVLFTGEVTAEDPTPLKRVPVSQG